jgi:hypothetical protein
MILAKDAIILVPVLRVNEIAESSIMLKNIMKHYPAGSGRLRENFCKRLKVAFDKELKFHFHRWLFTNQRAGKGLIKNEIVKQKQ